MFLPTRAKFVYPHGIRILAPGFHGLSESFLCILLVVEAVSLQKDVKMLEDLMVGWWDQVNVADETKF